MNDSNAEADPKADSSAESNNELNLGARLFGRSGEDQTTKTESAEGYRSGFIALVGRPNVGKSTLINAFVGEKVAITSPRPQTTRRRILGIRSTETAQGIFVDTPGIHKPEHSLGKYMVQVAQASVSSSDIAVWVVDVSHPPEDLDHEIARLLSSSHTPVILALNKSDKLKPENIAKHCDAYTRLVEPEDWILTIATQRHNLELLWDAMVARLPEGPPLYPEDQITDQTERMLASELVREAALTYLQEEIPHGLEVVIEEWQQRRDGLISIAAKIFVERDNHKGIVIGKGGSMLRKIGTRARREMEKMLGERVFLELFVSVRPGWRRNAADVRRLGFE
jgi:GTP-binding protein Era